MANDIYSASLIQSMARGLSITDLIRTVDTLRQSGQENSAATLYATWVRHNQDNPLLYAVLFNYSVLLSDAGNLAAAREALEKAIAINPDFLPAYINLGRVLERLGSAGSALAQWSVVMTKTNEVNGQAITYKTTALNQSARALESANQDEAAETLLRQSLELDPQQREVCQHYVALRQRQCEWPVIVPWERVSSQVLRSGISPLSVAAHTDDPFYQLGLAWHYNKSDVGNPPSIESEHVKARANRGRLRIGYLCSDFREHALGHLLAEVLNLHDRSKVEVFAYYCGPAANDALHLQFQATAEHWVPITELSDEAAANRMLDDGIQILVDLNGYTREARVKLLARRPAPVIVNWLGYPGTMGSPYHQYIIADDWIIPSSHERYYSEKVLRLPCYQPNNRHRQVAELKSTRAELGLPENGTVFCCFNGSHKITRFTFERWLMILSQVEGSVLWLLGNSETADARLKQYAKDRGIAPERIVFAAKLTNPHHLARYAHADLFLDTTPYGAHTTASDALWMGLPVLTWSGNSFASRVCGSLVRSAGVPELVCDSAEAYVETAVRLGKNRSQLAILRRKLAEAKGSCTLFDMPGLISKLENLYGEMWADLQADRLPVPDLRNLDVLLELGTQIEHEEIELQGEPDYVGFWQKRLEARKRIRNFEYTERF